jgi:hypothetical protein
MADFVAQVLPAPVFSVVADSAVASVVESGGGAVVAAIYAQRVWSTGSGEWCYYTTALNAAPASGITAPNWIGSATDYEVISRRLN